MSKSKALKVIAGASDKPLVIGDIEIPCYVLEDETRVLTQSGMFAALGLARRGLVPVEGGARLPRFAASKAINPFIPNDLRYGLENPIPIAVGPEAYGFPATMLPQICSAVLDARRAGALDPQQRRLAAQCEKIVEGLAIIGIIALVDEATGYQEIRAKRALATILEKFIAKELQPWTKTFPYEFYERIAYLKGWPSSYAIKRPSVVGHYTNDLIYARLAPGLLEELKSRTPRFPSGTLRNKHFQWFTPDIGHPRLKEHLAAVIALMKAAPNWSSFRRSLQRAFPKPGEQSQMELDD